MTSEPNDRRRAARAAEQTAGQPETCGGPGAAGRAASFLRGLAGGVAGGVVAGGAAGAAAGYYGRGATPPDPAAVANEAAVTGLLPAVPFHGTYQAGILPDADPGHRGHLVQT